jgi:hypothetical protein
VPDHDVDSWEPLRSELAGDVRRVADRLRSMSQPRLAGAPAPPPTGFPSYESRADGARAVATEVAHRARCLEASAPGAPHVPLVPVPRLSDFAAGDQVAVAGHDLLAALDLVGPGDEVQLDGRQRRPARDVVAYAQQLLTDLRRRL